jgi:parallel beta-helix repeat protein
MHLRNAIFIFTNTKRRFKMPITVDNIAALQNTQTSEVHVTIRGHDTANDGGGGLFFWDANETAAQDGGTIFTSNLSPTGRWKRVREDLALNVRWFGAKGDGSAGGGNAIQNVINLAQVGIVIYIPQGSYNITSTLTIGNKQLTLRGDGYGTYVYTTNAISIIKKSSHNSLLWVEKIRFDAQNSGATCIEFNDPALVDSQSLDLLVTDCIFIGYGNGIKLINARETIITQCKFDSGANGIYLKDSTNPTVVDCYFSPLAEGPSTRAIKYDGVYNSAYSAGLRILGCTMIGFAIGIEIIGTDYVEISSCMIDYCDLPIKIVDQDTGLIQGNYVGSRGVNGIEIRRQNIGLYSQHIKIAENSITTYAIASNRTGIFAEYVHGLHIVSNTIHFWNQYGISHNNCQRVFIDDNLLLSDPPNTGTPINNPTSGMATIAANQTTVTVNHGLGDSPAKVYLTPSVAVGCGVTSRTNMQITIQIASQFSYAVNIFWKVEL